MVSVTCTGPHWVWATDPVTVLVVDVVPLEEEESEELVPGELEGLEELEGVGVLEGVEDPVVASYDDPPAAVGVALGPAVEVL